MHPKYFSETMYFQLETNKTPMEPFELFGTRYHENKNPVGKSGQL